ncbi:UNVERIFIED_ORG: hypothetical protein ABIB52_003536 [Arthrobacter sp. UYCu721]
MSTVHTLHDEQIVDQLLLETEEEVEDFEDLRLALLELRSFAAGPPVAASAELAALMSTGPVSLDARRRRHRHHTAIAALAIAASMGIGSGAVAAADPGFREKAQAAINTVVNVVTQGRPGRPEPAAPPSPVVPAVPATTANAPDVRGPAGNESGRTGPKVTSSAPGTGNSGDEARPLISPGTPPVATPSKAKDTAHSRP